ncbi:MAG: endonuclease NucS [Candidatus Bathyarchaeota archaeon]|nr:endonuclease NucS [Candidatus Bathyarchaeota archaeon]MDH5732578.1 endonuclease NucS [Candidatus Bathyarchaeota archaeon]
MNKHKTIIVLERPSLEEAEEVVRRAFSERKSLVIVGNCWVDYKGRASSKLKAGERIVLIKEDGSVLVHRPTGYEPVNWQPPGCIFHTQVRDKVLQIRAVRSKPLESVRLFFDRVYLVSLLGLVDAGKFSLYASEEDMQKAVLLRPSLIEAEFKPISYEKKVEPGFIDVYGIDGNGKFVVVEIKRKTAGRDAALQLAKYVESVRNSVNRKVRGILAAPHMGKGVQKMLATLGLDFKPLDPRKCAEILSRSETRKLADFFEQDE